MVILGVDYGDVRTGLALCDRGEMLARPAGVICCLLYTSRCV